MSKIIPVFWNIEDGRLHIFFKMTNCFFQDGEHIINMELNKYINTFLKNKDSLSDQDINLRDLINIGFIYDLSIFENLSKIWKLVGWVVPIDYTNIIENTPRRKCYSVDKYEALLYENTYENKFEVFLYQWQISCHNSKSSIGTLPLDTIFTIKDVLFKD